MDQKSIAVDLRCLPIDGSAGAGIEHAAREVWRALYLERSRFNVELTGLAPRGAILDSEEGIMRLPQVSGGALREVLRHTSGLFDGLFVPSGAVAWGVTLPVFPWVHDLAIFEHPEWFPQSWLKRQLTTRLYLRGLKQAKHIFAVSEDTKRSIERIAGIASEKMTVTYQATMTSPLFDSPSWGLGEGLRGVLPPYALILGTLEPRKNIPFIVRLWPEVEKRLGQSMKLVIAGRKGWGDVFIPSSSSIAWIDQVDDGMRNQLIRGASILLLPSLHEGFGRLALEAMQMGTPVIASDRGALTEVIGQGGQTIPLERPDEWIAAIVHLLSVTTEHDRWSQRGKERASRFAWKAVAQTILARLSQDC